MWMRGALADTGRDTLPSFSQLDDPRYFPYRYGHAFLAWLAGHWGDQVIGQLLRGAGRQRDIGASIARVLKAIPDTLVARWHAETHATYDPLKTTTAPPETFGPALIAGKGDQGRYNVSPALSPDGNQVMFLSDRGLFSIDLFLADAHTGKVKRQITKTAVDPHYQSLQFIQSAGSWSPDGARFAFAGISGGAAGTESLRFGREKIERDIRLPSLDEVFNPSWSPDGRRIAFAGLVGGLSDLFVYDLESNKLNRLTNDAFADLQPVWSPDGRTLAFATDRFTTDLGLLKVGPLRHRIDRRRHRPITQLPGFEGARHTNPQWSPDGASLFFVADPDGISNVYRVDVAGGPIAQVTDLFTGVSGITETSPALSVAQRSGRLVIQRLSRQRLRALCHRLDEGVGWASHCSGPAAGRAALLPPIERRNPLLVALQKNAELGLPPDSAFPVQPYGAGLGSPT